MYGIDIGNANLVKSKVWPVPRPEQSGNVRTVSSLVDSGNTIPFGVWPAVNTFGLYQRLLEKDGFACRGRQTSNLIV